MLTVVAARVVGVDRAGVTVVRGTGKGVLVEARLRRDTVGVFQIIGVADEELEVALHIFPGVGRAAGGRGGRLSMLRRAGRVIVWERCTALNTTPKAQVT